MNSMTMEMGGLSCQVVDALPDGRPPTLTVVLCHGFGAPGTNLVGLASELILLRPRLADTVRFVFPAAPIQLDEQGLFEGRAWWMIDIAALTTAVERGELHRQVKETPAELPRVRAMLTRLIEEVERRFRTPISRIVLGGFSQGAILAADVALHLPAAPAALGIWSGMLVAESEWRSLAQQRGRLPVLQSHGRQDPIVPLVVAVRLRDMLKESGLEVEYIEFPGDHAIPQEALQRFAALLDRLTTK